MSNGQGVRMGWESSGQGFGPNMNLNHIAAPLILEIEVTETHLRLSGRTYKFVLTLCFHYALPYTFDHAYFKYSLQG